MEPGQTDRVEPSSEGRTRLRARCLDAPTPAELRYREDVIVEIGPSGTIETLETVPPEGPGSIDADLRPGVLTPGFVDTHVHYPQTRVVGSASGPLLAWLERTVFPEEARFADQAYAAAVAEEFAGHLLRAGTTAAMVFGSAHASASETLFETFARRGLRGWIGPALMDVAETPAPLRVPVEPALEGLERLRERWHGHEGRLELCVLPRFALSCTSEMMRAAGDYALEHGLRVSTHLSETVAEVAAVRERFGAPDYLTVYADHGLVHARSSFAHCIHVSDGELARLADAGASVAHCPDSNAFLGSGGMDTPRVEAAGVSVGLGTDVAAGRSFSVLSTASFAYDNGLRFGTGPSLAKLLWWATRGGARSLGLDGVGALEPGLQADLVLHHVPDHLEGADAVAGHLLFGLDRGPVERVWIAGDPILLPPRRL